MFLLILNLLQSQQPSGISWLVWTVAVLILVAGVSLLVYFFRRMRGSERAAEEEWDLSHHSLFAENEKREPQIEGEPARVEEKIETAQPKIIEESAPLIKVPAVEETALLIKAPTVEAPATQVSEPEPITEPQRASEPAAAADVTPVQEEEAPAFDDEVWADLDQAVQSIWEKSLPVQVDDDVQADIERAEQKPEEKTEIEPAAKVEHRAPTEPLKTESRPRREPFEPPEIEPLSASERAATERIPSRVEPPRTEVEPIETVAAQTTASGPRVKPGSVLGLPPEPSSAPLVFGKPSPTEGGVISLSNYGKDTSAGGGTWGTITLIVVIVLIGGSVFAYLQSSWVHEKVDAFVSRMRGAAQTQTAQPQPTQTDKPKAQVFSSPSEASKNVVKARGRVYNISEETLAGLAVEVTLDLNGGETETKIYALTPPDLAPMQQGIYEFDYDGKKCIGYTVTRLLSNGSEVKFIAPSRKQQTAANPQ